MGINKNHNKNLGLAVFPLLFISTFFLFISCKKNEGKEEQAYKKPSSGPINIVSVFSSEDLFQQVAPSLQDTLLFGKVFPGLYYPPEIMFGIRFFDAENESRFSGTRLILEIKKGNPSIEITKDKFAKPQGYVSVTGSSPQEIIALLHKNQDSILNTYRWADRQFLLADYIEKATNETPSLDSIGVSMVVPKDFVKVKANPTFVWYRKDKVNTITNRDARNNLVNKSSYDIINIFAYKVPYTQQELNLKDLVKISDSVTAKYTEGGKDPETQYIGKDSLKVEMKDYVQVEKNPILMGDYDFTPLSKTQRVNTYESQGWWSMTLSQMGGPYTIKAILDKEKKQLYIAQAVLFAPLNQGKSKKRDHLTGMEALFTTFKIKQ